MTTEQVRQALRTGETRITSLAALVRVAIEDGRKLDPDTYHPNYEAYHSPRDSGCNVCFAGAVIAGTLSPSDPLTRLGPGSFGEAQNALYALDHVRMGDLGDAYSLLQLPDLDTTPGVVAIRERYFTGMDSYEIHLNHIEQSVLPVLRSYEAQKEFVDAVAEQGLTRARNDVETLPEIIGSYEEDIAGRNSAIEVLQGRNDADMSKAAVLRARLADAQMIVDSNPEDTPYIPEEAQEAPESTNEAQGDPEPEEQPEEAQEAPESTNEAQEDPYWRLLENCDCIRCEEYRNGLAVDMGGDDDESGD